MVEDLIVRYKLKDYHLILLSFVYGTIYCAYTSGIVFLKPVIAGIDLYTLTLINLFWWGSVQAVLTFYIANLLVKREWKHERLSKRGWFIAIAVNLFTVVLFKSSGYIPHGTPLGNFTILLIVIASLMIFVSSLKRHKPQQVPFQSNRFLNAMAFLTIGVFAFCAIFLTRDPILSGTSNVNETSLSVVSQYTFILGIMLFSYRIYSKKGIPV